MYQFIRVRILLFSSTDCKVVHVLPNAINITYNNFIVISTAKHINAVTSSYSFQHSLVSGIWSRSSKVYWCMYVSASKVYWCMYIVSPHSPPLFLFVHLSIIGSILSFRYRQKRSHWLCMQPFHPRHDGCGWHTIVSIRYVMWFRRCQLVGVGLIVYDSTGQESCRGTTYCIYWHSLYSGCRWSGAWSPEMFTTSMEHWCTAVDGGESWQLASSWISRRVSCSRRTYHYKCVRQVMG